jgi:hypothetical protein
MKSIRIFFIIALSVGLFAGCKPETTGELGEPSDKLQGMGGTWELTSFIQQDPNNPVLEERDLSEFYLVSGVEPMRITLDVPTQTYTVTITEGKNFFGESGTWSLDDNLAPSSITLMNANDTLELFLGNMVLPTSSNMGLQYHRVCSDDFKNVIYKFNFQRI